MRTAHKTANKELARNGTFENPLEAEEVLAACKTRGVGPSGSNAIPPLLSFLPAHSNSVLRDCSSCTTVLLLVAAKGAAPFAGLS